MSDAMRTKLYRRIVQTPSGCWEWTGSRTKAGYGDFQHDGVKYYAHRASWLVHHGPIPAGAHVLHRCDNRSCWNPSHLFLGDNQANTDDKIAKGRMRHGHVYGEQHPNSRLTWEQVRDIRQRYASGQLRKNIAQVYGVDTKTIRLIVIGRTWKEPGALVTPSKKYRPRMPAGNA